MVFDGIQARELKEIPYNASFALARHYRSKHSVHIVALARAYVFGALGDRFSKRKSVGSWMPDSQR
jgi:hypothetical protein